jgi:hypothetical protein
MNFAEEPVTFFLRAEASLSHVLFYIFDVFVTGGHMAELI